MSDSYDADSADADDAANSDALNNIKNELIYMRDYFNNDDMYVSKLRYFAECLERIGHNINDLIICKYTGRTILFEVVGREHGGEEATAYLLERGGNIHSKDNYGCTPLIISFYSVPFKKNIIQLLLSHGADINSKDKNGFTLLHHMIVSNNKDIMERVSFLLDHGIDKTIRNNEGYTAESFARSKGLHDVAEYINQHEHSIIFS